MGLDKEELMKVAICREGATWPVSNYVSSNYCLTLVLFTHLIF